jgi:sec-independent protein translocase protein TatA
MPRPAFLALLPLGVTMGGLSIWHWLIVMMIVLLLFGNRLPSVMRSLGEGVVEFKKGLQGIEEDKEKSPADKKLE